MSLFEFFWNVRQQQQIGSTATTATLAADTARAHDVSLVDLTRRFDRLALVTQALAELLTERAHVPEAELLAKIDEIDLRDGVRDGRASSTRSCPKCRRPSPGHHASCLYCGAALGSANPLTGL